MKAYSSPPYGSPSILSIKNVPKPICGDDDLLVEVRAIGINRADCLQRSGNYPPPKGANNILGLELCGHVINVGKNVKGYEVGDHVFGLVASGAYAEYALIDYRLAVLVPKNWSSIKAAGVIEVFCTANESIIELGKLKKNETILVHAGASGVGTTVIQMAKFIGAKVIFTSSNAEKIDKVLELGADLAINYKTHNFVEEVFRFTNGKGVDVIEDFIGADYLEKNLTCLNHTGRLILVGLMGVEDCKFNPAIMLRKRLKIFGFTLRSQSVLNKMKIIKRFKEKWLPLLVEDKLLLPIHQVYSFNDAVDAHFEMESNKNIGKIILKL